MSNLRNRVNKIRKLLYLDSSFTLSQIRARGLEHVLQVRFLDGYFDRVWSAHPVDTHPASHPVDASIGAPIYEHLSEDHVFVRGRYGRFEVLSPFPALNALLALSSFVRSLILLVKRENIGLIRAGDPLLCGLIGLIVARWTGARLVVRINGDHDMIRANTGTPIMPSLFRTGAIENQVERMVLSRADWIFAPSSNYSDFAVRKGAPPSRVSVVRYGNLIDTRHFSDPAARGDVNSANLRERLAERPWMVHLGRLQKLKHAEDCYEVLRIIAEQDNEVGLLLIGDGPLRETIAGRAEVDGLSERVLFLGNIEQDTMTRILPRCTLALSPLTGRALAEVAFAALPIVAYDIDWQGEVVVTDVTGVLVPAGDIAAMARGAGRLLADASLRKTLGAEARRRALDLLEPREQTRREIEAYASLGGSS